MSGTRNDAENDAYQAAPGTEQAAPEPKEPPHVIRLMQEGNELHHRMALLTGFLNSEAVKTIPPLEADLLLLQLEAMQPYLHILSIRLAIARGTAPIQPRPPIIKPPGIIMPGQR